MVVSHEVNYDLHVLEDFEVKQDEDKAHVRCQRDYKLPIGVSCIVLEEGHDLTLVDPTLNLMDDYFQELVHYSSSYTHMDTNTHRDEFWVKRFFNPFKESQSRL